MVGIVNKNVHFKENKKYYIYIHTCPNQWTYVGMSQNPEERWNNGEGYKDNKNFYYAIQLFGWKNIKHEIVAETYYRWVAQKIERTLITHFKNKNKCFNENNIETKLVINNNKSMKKVGQYNKNSGELIKEYDSIREARDFTGIAEYSIKANCKNKTKTAGGYIWKYL